MEYSESHRPSWLRVCRRAARDEKRRRRPTPTAIVSHPRRTSVGMSGAGGHYDSSTMRFPVHSRFLRALGCVLLLMALWPSGAASAQDEPIGDVGEEAEAEAAATAVACAFTKADAIEANDGPLGSAIWGRLCQLI